MTYRYENLDETFEVYDEEEKVVVEKHVVDLTDDQLSKLELSAIHLGDMESLRILDKEWLRRKRKQWEKQHDE